MYDDPALLTDAQAAEVQMEISGDVLHIHSTGSDAAHLRILVTVSDGIASASQLLEVELLDPATLLWSDPELLASL